MKGIKILVIVSAVCLSFSLAFGDCLRGDCRNGRGYFRVPER